jgi:hypothetical protein
VREIKERLLQTREEMPGLRLYSASVLAIYDGDRDSTQLVVKLIDFAHAYIDVRAEGVQLGDAEFEDNAVVGLVSLVSLLIK